MTGKPHKHQEMRILVAKALRLADDGNWPECYADDVSQLLDEIAVLKRRVRRTAGGTTTPPGMRAGRRRPTGGGNE